MKKYQFITIIILILVLLGSAFYWLSYRPEKVRRECNEKFNVASQRVSRRKSEERTNFTDNPTEAKYLECIREKGIN